MLVFFFNITATTGINTYLPTLSLHAALPSTRSGTEEVVLALDRRRAAGALGQCQESANGAEAVGERHDRPTMDDPARGADLGPHGQLARDAVLDRKSVV